MQEHKKYKMYVINKNKEIFVAFMGGGGAGQGAGEGGRETGRRKKTFELSCMAIGGHTTYTRRL